MNQKIKLIINPVAGNNAFQKAKDEFHQAVFALLGDVSTAFTTAVGEATRLAQNALRDGYRTIVAVGGDGTINEVVNGFFEDGRPVSPEAELAVISMGTGGDWVKTLELPEELHEAAKRIAEGRTKLCDVGLLTCRSSDDRPVQRYFINIADAGFGGTMVERVNQSTKALGQFFAYLIGLLRTLAVYKNKPVEIQVDDVFHATQVVNSVVVANGQFFGGGMWVAPEAKLDDGLFDVVIIGDVNRAEVLANTHRLYNGTLGRHHKVTTLRGKEITLRSEHDVYIEADGELPGKLPAKFQLIPTALRIIC
ncbi:MAG: diacylglycerol kinase family lipid kinase [Calditrichaeota bacterium]|nr:MAG: diacylglycerol kinase family lipid kinase [Calditrichota bacterium]